MNSPPRLLLAEDDPLLRLLLQTALERAGYSVTAVVNGREAAAHQRREPFDLLLTDLVMPEQEGLETIMEFRQRHPDVRIVAMSGGGRGNAESYLAVATRLGADQILGKPFSNERLLEVIAEQVGPATPPAARQMP